MADKTGSIPELTHLSPELQRVLQPIKEKLEALTGQRGGFKKIALLDESDTNLETRIKVNELINRLNLEE